MGETFLLVEPPRWRGWPMMRADRCSRPAMYGGIPFPYWLASTAAYLRENGVNVEMYDANALNSDWSTVKKIIRNCDPKIVLFSSSNCSIDFDLNVAKIAKQISKNILTAVIEPVLSPRRPEEIFRICPELDVIYLGEPEQISLDLHQQGRRASGIAYKNHRKIIRTSSNYFDISDLSMPAYDMLPMELYSRIPVRMSRGCPYNCVFCTLGSGSNTSAFDKRLRFRNTEKVIEELKYLSSIKKQIFFFDETFTISKKRVISFCDALIASELNMAFGCQTRVNCVDEDTISKLKNAGCTQIGYGIESGDNLLLSKMKKNITVEDIKRAFRLTSKYGIETSAYNIIGLPGETRKTAEKTIALNKELLPDQVQFSVATPLIGTEFWEYCLKNKCLTADEEIVERAIIGTHSYVSYENLKLSDVYSLVQKGMSEINKAYFKHAPKGVVPKVKFFIRRLTYAYKLHMLPKSEFPGKVVIVK